MYWVVLILSGALETVWAAALNSLGEKFRVGIAAIFAVAALLSLGGLTYAMKTIPVGTAYAVWVGVGVVFTVAYGAIALDEPLSLLKILFVAMILGGIVGLKFA